MNPQAWTIAFIILLTLAAIIVIVCGRYQHRDRRIW